MQDRKKIVIVGGVAAGPKAASRARRLLPEAEITIIEQGEVISYGNCGLPLYLEGALPDITPLISTAAGINRDPAYFAREKNINFLTKTRATAIDRNKKEVTILDLTTQEEKRISYDQLVLATGSRPVILPVPGTDLTGVTAMHHPSHAQQVKSAIDAGAKTIYVIGGGLVGIETAAALFAVGREVVLLERADQLLPGIVDSEIAELLQVELEESGIEVRTGETLISLQGNEAGRLQQVVTDDGSFDADIVILACGVRPNVDLAKDCGLDIGTRGGIRVNEFLQTSDPDIYAAGDCVENKHLVSGDAVYLPLASTANKQGRVIGSNLAGRREVFPGVLGTMAMQVFKMNMGRTGMTEGEALKKGLSAVSVLISGHEAAHFFPGHKGGVIKLLADAVSGKILGAQVAGAPDLIKRLDVLATAIQFGATVDQFQHLDLAYAPPFATPIDLALHAANTWKNINDGLADGLSPLQFQELLAGAEDFIVLDVRTPRETKSRPVNDRRVVRIPLTELRERIGEISSDKKVIALCHLGGRSYEAACILKGAGFSKVAFAEGGIFAMPDLD